jgi:hypothetical protein
MLFEKALSLILLGLVIVELVSGKMPTRTWKPFITHAERPFRYWLHVILQVAMALVFAYLAIRGIPLFERIGSNR